MEKRKLIGIGVVSWLVFSAFLVWAMFFPSQGFLRSTASRAKSITTSYAKSVTGGILIAENIHKTRFSSGRIVYLLDDGIMYSRYFNRPIRIRGISGSLVWTSASGGLSLVLPALEMGPAMDDILAGCGAVQVTVEIDTLGYLLVTREDGALIRCDPGHGAGVSPFAKDATIEYGSVPIRLVNENRVSHLTFDGYTASGRLLDAKFAEIMTNGESRRDLFIAGEPVVEFQKSLTAGSPRYLGRFTAEGTRWETRLGSHENEIVRINHCFLRDKLLIILGNNNQSQTCAIAISVGTGKVQWEKRVE
ncbi:MAG: hypothetical protein EAS52_09065 [Parapedobacter sp.]|nr:MAG: hypothetical protein EAS52_09065 [Parapedobacter sp.]